VKNIAISWSSGKDSAYTLFQIQKSESFKPVALFTTFNSETGLVPIQGVPIEVVREQVRCIGLPLIEIDLPVNCPNTEYEKRVVAALKPYQDDFVSLAFGDLFLNEIKEYRESFLKPAGFELVFPLMGMDTVQLARQIISCGFHAKLSSVDSTQLDARFCGDEFNKMLLASLPAQVDPCGERGEFHTFVYAGPIFQNRPQVRFSNISRGERFALLSMNVDAGINRMPPKPL
jgi:uncharacterized protein (TIGR00290 family)